VLPDIAPVIDVSSESLRKELLFAFLGGLILNLMPCVFPVLSIKALSLVKKSQQAPWEVRRHGMVFTLGVLTCFLVIAGVLLILRYSGAQLGWGFQLQSPIVVTLLAYLMFAVGLSLSGVFTLGSSLMGLGSGVAAKPGYLGSFATGMLATLVATPCTAPFMGTALGFALTQPWAVGLAVFMTLGFGLAFPYLLLSFFPPLFRFLPKPGPWMVRFKELLAFPMYATAAWLIWVLTLQTGSEGIVTALFGLILIAFAAWLFNCTRLPSQGWRRAGNVGTVAVLLMALGLVELPVFEQSDTPSPHRTGEGPEWQPFSQERLAALRAQGKPVFINFSAAWCITCLTNERVALKSSRLAKAFEENGIVYLKADWTNRNPKITAVLSSFGRTGVPLYVYYPPKADKLVILPQILTEAIILEYLNLIGGPGIFENVYY
jgi:thiol:disulfide interchange protein DsbD